MSTLLSCLFNVANNIQSKKLKSCVNSACQLTDNGKGGNSGNVE
jgi:hypothetical protein